VNLTSFQTILERLLETKEESCCALSGINISDQFSPEDKSVEGKARNMNACFAIHLFGAEHSLYKDAHDYLQKRQEDSETREVAQLYVNAVAATQKELTESCDASSDFKDQLEDVAKKMEAKGLEWKGDTITDVWSVFFPEGSWSLDHTAKKVEQLRAKRKVTLLEKNPNPIVDPGKELLFTSNALLTLPEETDLDKTNLSESIKSQLGPILGEDQKYWYDHPIPLDIDPESNEVIYGLKGLDRAIEFEIQKGESSSDQKVDCVLSISVTHSGLQNIAKLYLQELMKSSSKIEHLNVYAFSEAQTLQLIKEVFEPAVQHYFSKRTAIDLVAIFGVDGEYGRHYSFLKAISAFWKVFIEPEKRATFKFDLDQIFPQAELCAQGGGSAFQHFKSDLWGAKGKDADGQDVTLGMIAGALVNEKDIPQGLFTPDVPFPESIPSGESLVFYNKLPMALSSEAEMMTRYRSVGGDIDDDVECLSRIHVTGGTNGIMIDALRHYRPFTPTFIGRAEDQAYLLSVLFATESPLRYVHKSGLIMRHDKEAFAGQAIEAAKSGRFVGDLVRTLYFSYYVKALPWSDDKIKETIDPFTGCFASKIPFTLIFLRLCFNIAENFLDPKKTDVQEVLELQSIAADRLPSIVKSLSAAVNPIVDKVQRERDAWDLYYDVLDQLEMGLASGDSFAIQLQKNANEIIHDAQVI
jgi:hypothetical protein